MYCSSFVLQIPSQPEEVLSPDYVLSPQAKEMNRGIPGGYLNTLEHRLDETENALYNALMELRALKSNNNVEHYQNKISISGRQANATKTSRMAEWKALPLKDSQDLQRWWEGVGSSKEERNKDTESKLQN